MDHVCDTLILAGCGSMGGAFLKLGGDFLSRFRQVHLVDRQYTSAVRSLPAGERYKYHCGDVEDGQFLRRIAGRAEGCFLLVNLCDGTDNFNIRSHVSALGGAYIDTSASSLTDSREVRLSQLMPRTMRRTANLHPHLVCCGVNPGMVELIARREIAREFAESEVVDIEFYEYDSFDCPSAPLGCVPVSWSASTLIEEVMLTPPFELRGGVAFESPRPKSDSVAMRWQGRHISARKVAHEEIWNLQHLSNIRVGNSSFIYAFRPALMKLLAGGVTEAKHAVWQPQDQDAVEGVDSLAIKLGDRASGKSRTLVWSTDHGEVYQRLGINAVQYQVSSSLLVFCELLILSAGELDSQVHSASTLPLSNFSDDQIGKLLAKYNVDFQLSDDSPVLELRSVAKSNTYTGA